ncbi:MAG: class I SAM-dependent methyltransferase [Kineosporiaceae bacterium]
MPIPPIPAWDHNAWYHPLLLSRIPPGATRVLEIGCGEGTLATAIASRGITVDAVDRSPVMIDAARTRVPDGVRLHLADVLTDPLPGDGYDAVLSLSTLHHLPLPDALPKLAAAVRPGGVIAAVALPRLDLRREWHRELAAGVAENAFGAAFALTGRLRHHGDGDMPVAQPTLTTAQVREQADAVLPGVRVRRLTFWRYELLWQRPA